MVSSSSYDISLSFPNGYILWYTKPLMVASEISITSMMLKQFRCSRCYQRIKLIYHVTRIYNGYKHSWDNYSEACSVKRSFSGFRKRSHCDGTGSIEEYIITVLNTETLCSIDYISKNIDNVIDLFGCRHGRQHAFF